MIHFAGDINLTDWNFSIGFGTGTKIKKGFNPFMYLDRRKEDLWVGNFEGVSASKSDYKGIYGKAFRIHPNDLTKIKHFDFYGFANNHAMEHGAAAYVETVKTLEGLGCKVFGQKNNHSVQITHKAKVISMTGICFRIEQYNQEPLYWYNPEYIEIEEEVKQLPQDAFKVLFVHWGNEFINRPSAAQKKLAHWLIDAGYDLIIGMHPHVLQGYEDYNGGRIYYSLGNFVFEMPSEQCKIGAIVNLDFVANKPVYSEDYVRIDGDGCPHIVSESEIPAKWCFEYLNERLKIDDNTEEYHSEIKRGYLVYRNANRKQLLASAFSHPGSFCGVLTDFVKRKIGK